MNGMGIALCVQQVGLLASHGFLTTMGIAYFIWMVLLTACVAFFFFSLHLQQTHLPCLMVQRVQLETLLVPCAGKKSMRGSVRGVAFVSGVTQLGRRLQG